MPEEIRARKVIGLGYTTKRHCVTKADIDSGLFEVIMNRRLISNAQVNSIRRWLEEGHNFSAALVVNKIGNRLRLIDGNHRGEAMKKYLTDNPRDKVEVLLQIYEGLTPDEEREIYTMFNKGRKQSTNDFIQQYKDDIIPAWRLISDPKKFCIRVNVYGNPETLSFYKVVSSYLASKTPRFSGGFIGSPLEFLDRAKALKKEDIDLMNCFFADYQEAFGPMRNNPWYKTTPITAMMRIWMDNREELPSNIMVDAFKRKLARDYNALDIIGPSGASACKYARDKLLQMLNAGRTRVIFLKKEVIPDRTEEDPEED